MKWYQEKYSRTLATTVLAPISWGTGYLVVTEMLPPDRPLLVACMRVVPAGLVLVSMRRRSIGIVRPRGDEWWRTAVLALFNFGLFFPLLAVAVYRLPGGVASAVGGAQPLLVAGLTRIVTGLRVPRVTVVVGVVAALGVMLVVIRPGADVDVVGVLAALASTASFAVGVVLTKRFPPPKDRVASTGWQLLIGGALLVPVMLCVEGAPPHLDARNLLGFAYLSLVTTALAFVVWFDGIGRLPASAPPLLGLAAPVTGTVLGWVLLGQSLSAVQLIGFALTLGAIVVGTLIARAPESAARVATPGTPDAEAAVGMAGGGGCHPTTPQDLVALR